MTSMSPDQIREVHNATTWQEVCDVADALKRVLPVEKNIDEMVRLMKKDRCSPYDAMKSVISSALDWFAYGN